MKRLKKRIDRQIKRLQKQLDFLREKAKDMPDYDFYPPSKNVREIDQKMEDLYYLIQTLKHSIHLMSKHIVS